MIKKVFRKVDITSQSVRLPGGLPEPEKYGELVNVEAVIDMIGCEVTSLQRQVIRKHLNDALKDFIIREKGSFEESQKLPFVDVNRRTNVLAIHSRLLITLQLAVEKSRKKLGIDENSDAFDEVG